MNDKNYFEDLVSEAKEYAGLRVDELKLKTANGLSTALSGVLSMLLIVAVGGIILGLLAFALLQWINSLVGAPWGTLIVCAFFAIVLTVLLIFRKKMFRNVFVKLFVDIFYDADEEE